MESFYVNLPSNVTTFRSDNSISCYRTALPSPLLLDSSWRVGLAEIHYTNSWFNLREYNYVNIVSFDDPSKQLIKTVILPPGRYSDINYLIQLITFKATQRSSDPGCSITVMPQLGHNTTSRRLTMKFGRTQQHEYVVYSFTKELEELLGVTRGWYSREHDLLQHQPYVSDSPNEVWPKCEHGFGKNHREKHTEHTQSEDACCSSKHWLVTLPNPLEFLIVLQGFMEIFALLTGVADVFIDDNVVLPVLVNVTTGVCAQRFRVQDWRRP